MSPAPLHPNSKQAMTTREYLAILAPFALVLAILIAGTQFGRGNVQNGLALAALLALPGCAGSLYFRSRLAFLLFTCGGYLLVFGAIKTPALFPGLAQAVLLLLPALAIHLLMSFGRHPHPLIANFTWPHLYVPAAIMVAGAIFFAVQAPAPRALLATFSNALTPIYYLYYATLLGLLCTGYWKDFQAMAPAKPTISPVRLEEQGQFETAAQLYEQDGNLEKGALMAQKAANWARSAELYRQAGNHFMAGDMYYRAGQLEEALEMYEKAGAASAAATLCVATGQPERGARLLEKSGDPQGAVAALEQAGLKPSPQQYLNAKQFEQAAARCLELGDAMRAAEITEHELADLEGAAVLYLACGMPQKAGELFEYVGKTEAAIEAYLGSKDSILQAARLCFTSGDGTRARQLLEQQGGSNEEALLILASVYCQEERYDEAIRALQTVKKQVGCSGELNYLLGRSYLAKGLPELAEPELRAAMTYPLAPQESLDAAYQLGHTLEQLQRSGEALEIYQGILAKDLYFKDTEGRYRQLKAAANQPRA